MNFSKTNYWALILGGSSGFGLATAKKLASKGMNICIVHRDRKGSMAKIKEGFDEIRATKVKFVTFNKDALSSEVADEILTELKAELGSEGKIRLMLHSIAFGNLKLIAKQVSTKKKTAAQLLAEKLGIEPEKVTEAANALFEEEHEAFFTLADEAKYNNEVFIEDEDMSNTIFAMGTSMLSYTQKVHSLELFADDARVIGLTSEGNEVAWRGYAAVSAAKVALESVSRSIALEFAPYGIRSNIVQPGVTQTPALRLIPGSKHLSAVARRRNPFKRQTLPEDVANLISLLCTDEAAWVNGTIIRCDGGEHIVG